MPWGLLVAALIAIAIMYGRDQIAPLLSDRAAPPLAEAATTNAVVAEPTPTLPIATAAPTELPVVAAAERPAEKQPTPTAAPGGSIETLAPGSGAAGWWAEGDLRAEHLDDSYLYAGTNQGRPILSLIRFDLNRLPPGAPVLAADLRLTGLSAERLDPAQGGVWKVELLPEAAAPEISRLGYPELAAGQSAITLSPQLTAGDLVVGTENVLPLTAEAIQWLQEQLNQGAKLVLARISGPQGSADSLYAWDSGAGPATGGNPPSLLISLGAPPETPPAAPTEQMIVATLTPTPGNVLTAAADALTATKQAATQGTATPSIYAIATPTPPAGNLATVEAMRFAAGLPPLVIYTATPANAETAEFAERVATAVALTTGTFTPVPDGAVTPIIILPTPKPENVATLAAQMLTMTVEAEQRRAATPLPFGAVMATTTPTPVLLKYTLTPENRATAAYLVVEATANVIVYGTNTPLPPFAMTPTRTPAPTALPLIQWEDALTPRPSPTPTAAIPNAWPAAFQGNVLFMSDRDTTPRLMLLDPATGRTAFLTQDWPARKARAIEPLSPDGRYDLVVQEDSRRIPQVHIRELSSGGMRQLTTTTGWSYDPAWSPRGDRIAFVSQEAGNDEIYTMGTDGSDLLRLTTNTWEWDKHPSWSPDGRQIVFWSNRDTGQRQLWVMNADGSNQRPLLTSPYNDWDPLWVK